MCKSPVVCKSLVQHQIGHHSDQLHKASLLCSTQRVLLSSFCSQEFGVSAARPPISQGWLQVHQKAENCPMQTAALGCSTGIEQFPALLCGHLSPGASSPSPLHFLHLVRPATCIPTHISWFTLSISRMPLCIPCPPDTSHTSSSCISHVPQCTPYVPSMHCAPHHASRPPHAFRLPPSALPTSPLPPTTPCALCGSHVPTSGQHRCQHHAARPHVHRLGPELGATQQLGGHVGQGAAHLVQQPLAAVMLEDGGQAKIGDFQVVWAKRKKWLKADNRGAPGCPWHAPRSSRSRFSGFRSRWVMPMLCR